METNWFSQGAPTMPTLTATAGGANTPVPTTTDTSNSSAKNIGAPDPSTRVGTAASKAFSAAANVTPTDMRKARSPGDSSYVGSTGQLIAGDFRNMGDYLSRIPGALAAAPAGAADEMRGVGNVLHNVLGSGETQAANLPGGSNATGAPATGGQAQSVYGPARTVTADQMPQFNAGLPAQNTTLATPLTPAKIAGGTVVDATPQGEGDTSGFNDRNRIIRTGPTLAEKAAGATGSTTYSGGGGNSVNGNKPAGGNKGDALNEFVSGMLERANALRASPLGNTLGGGAILGHMDRLLPSLVDSLSNAGFRQGSLAVAQRHAGVAEEEASSQTYLTRQLDQALRDRAKRGPMPSGLTPEQQKDWEAKDPLNVLREASAGLKYGQLPGKPVPIAGNIYGGVADQVQPYGLGAVSP